MTKKIIALAVAGLMSGAAFAQSNVTVSGVIDAGYHNTKSGDNKKTGIDSGQWSSSRIAFSGTEDLGNGVKAVFNLEYSIANDTNEGIGTVANSSTGATRARAQYVGLAGDFGTVIAGRFNSPGKTLHDKYDAMTGSIFFSTSQRLNGGVTAGALSSMNERLSNAVAYVSPSLLGGLTATVGYAFAGTKLADGSQTGFQTSGDGTKTPGNDSERTLGLSLDYTAGPLGIGYAYHRINDASADGDVTSPLGRREHTLVGMYDFGMAKLFANYTKVKATNSTVGVADIDNKVVTVGAVVPVTAMSNVRFSYSKLNHDVADTDAKGWSLFYDHNLSKRTTAYVGYTKYSNDDLSTRSPGATVAAGSGDSARGIGLGMVHKF